MKNIVFTFAFCLATPALSCNASKFGAAQTQIIPPKPDQKLFSAAVLAATNFERCKSGKRALRDHATTRKTALLHSRNMAKTKTFNHVTRAGGAQTLKDRARKTRLRWRWIGENIALLPRYQFGHKTTFQVIDRATCQFKNPQTGQQIPAHTYESLARTTVARWMQSDGHRKNIQHRRAGRMSAALIFDASAPNCGRFYITQVFAD